MTFLWESGELERYWSVHVQQPISARSRARVRYRAAVCLPNSALVGLHKPQCLVKALADKLGSQIMAPAEREVFGNAHAPAPTPPKQRGARARCGHCPSKGGARDCRGRRPSNVCTLVAGAAQAKGCALALNHGAVNISRLKFCSEICRRNVFA